MKPRGEPKIGPFRDRIREIQEEDKTAPRKQRHTAKRIFERLREEGYTGGYTQVKKVVREMKTRTREVFVPLVHRAGEAQVDFGHAAVKENGRLHKIVFFVMVLPYSDAFFVQVFDSECTEVLRRRMESEFGGMGTREYIRTLRLLEKHSLRKLTRAVARALEVGAFTRDAVAQFLFPREEWRETTFRLDGREHLRHVRVSSTDVSAYSGLLRLQAAGGDA